MSSADVDDLHAAMDAAEPGSRLEVRIARGTAPMHLEVALPADDSLSDCRTRSLSGIPARGL